MAWTVNFSKKAAKQLKDVPRTVQSAVVLLIAEIRISGPVRGNWSNYSKLPGSRHHCHVKKGNPTYVAVWKEDSRLSMLEHTKKHRIKGAKGQVVEARFAGDSAKMKELRLYAEKLGIKETTGTVPLEQILPEMLTNAGGVCLRGGRTKENLTQTTLSKLTGISQRHLSEMENGKRPIGKETAKKLAEVLKVDYRVFL